MITNSNNGKKRFSLSWAYGIIQEPDWLNKRLKDSEAEVNIHLMRSDNDMRLLQERITELESANRELKYLYQLERERADLLDKEIKESIYNKPLTPTEKELHKTLVELITIFVAILTEDGYSGERRVICSLSKRGKFAMRSADYSYTEDGGFKSPYGEYIDPSEYEVVEECAGASSAAEGLIRKRRLYVGRVESSHIIHIPE